GLRLHAPRLQAGPVASRRQPVQHPVQRSLGEQVPAGEEAIALQLHLHPGSVARPRLLDRHPPAAQGQLPVLLAVPVTPPFRIMPATGTYNWGILPSEVPLTTNNPPPPP